MQMKPINTTQKLRMGAAFITALSVGSAWALPAFADSSLVLRNNNGAILAKASFTSRGDVFRVQDVKGDGRGAYAFWRIVATDRSGNCVNQKGAGSSVTCDYDFREGNTIRWNLCVIDANGAGKTLCTKEIKDNTSKQP
jgi:hypothetical protein